MLSKIVLSPDQKQSTTKISDHRPPGCSVLLGTQLLCESFTDFGLQID